MDVENWQPNTAQKFDLSSFGYPLQKFEDIPAGEYFVQVLFHKYEIFNRADGHIVKLPMDRGEGQKWNHAPGNVYSTAKKINLNGATMGEINISIDQIIPPIEAPKDTKYLKHVKMKSKLLSEFWGRDIYLGAHVLLPEGYDIHSEVRYPLAIMHGHFPKDFGGFRTTPQTRI